MTTVGYLGPKATFTEYAVKSVFEQETRVPYDSIYDCLDAVKNGEVSYGVVPLENTIEGSVTITLDYLIHESPLSINCEIVVPIYQHLMIHPNNLEYIEQISAVYSHSHALAQCRKYLATTYPSASQIQTLSTSAAAQYVANNPDLKIAAVGNQLAAIEYGLVIKATNIQDFENNHTRFIIVNNKENEKFTYAKESKSTIIVTLPLDQAGALHQVLSTFAWRKINLTKIESRPMKTGLGNYLFIIDIDQTMDSILVHSAINELEALGCAVTCLGSYPVIKTETLIL